MNTRRTPAKRVVEKVVIGGFPPRVKKVEKVHQGSQFRPQGNQVPIFGEGNEYSLVPWIMVNQDIREAPYLIPSYDNSGV